MKLFAPLNRAAGFLFLVLCLALAVHGGVAAAPGGDLWRIGATDDKNAEFSLAPNGYAQFGNNGLYVVGESDAKRDWPYVHPGPHDGWAGGRAHTFIVLFGLKAVPAAGTCRFEIDVLDAHASSPPKLKIEVNGTAAERTLSPGAGDATVFGQPSKGKEQKVVVEFPSSALREGDNAIRVTTLAGSWFLYDGVALATPEGAVMTGIRGRTLVESVESVRALREVGGKLFQPVRVTLRRFGGAAEGLLRVEGAAPMPFKIGGGMETVEALVPAVSKETDLPVVLEVAGAAVAVPSIALKPVRKLTVYILPHSHTDIGYTEIQTAIEKRQVDNLLEGIRHARRTASYPAGARFIWNVEVLWAADLYLRRLTEPERADFFDAVAKGQVALNGMYLNELTGLCRPEELIRLFRFATTLGERCGVRIDSAMISDVPGYTWGTVPAMVQAGISYFSVAPNYFDRIGTILREWENKPFYWLGPDGKSKVLVWIPFWGYAMSHRYGALSAKLVDEFTDGLEKRGYPFDIAHVRWSGHGDNAVPDPAICDFVKEWNAAYAWPRFIISSTSDAFRALEERYADKLPVVRGDWTPYWEDGAGSSALETGMNRQSSDRLAQAETLFAMLKPSAYPAAAFEDAWNSVLLYSEHTWGAYCSISEPERRETREQWDIKRGYAVAADTQSRDLLARALARDEGPVASAAIDVLNTASWTRTDLAIVPASVSGGGDGVIDERGTPVPSQRLTTGELAVLVRDVPPFGARRYALVAKPAPPDGPVVAQGTTIENGILKIRVDEKTGGIVELAFAGIDGNLADTSGGESLNEYLYLVGDDLANLKRSGPATVRIGEAGPLVASLLVESDAPGTKKLRCEIRLVAGSDHAELVNVVDKARLVAASYHAKEGKESVNFAFPFRVPGGDVRLDVPFGIVRPEVDQMPSACKNWFTVSRWADVSNAEFGVTWVTLDAPLLEVGGITATLLNSQTDPDVWRSKVEPTQKFYSWAMNNHWGTNYRAYQEGPTSFRFVLRPHRGRDAAEASRFALGFGMPLLAVPARGAAAPAPLGLRVEPPEVLVTACKPSDDGRATIVRLWCAGERDVRARLAWSAPAPSSVWLSDTSEKPRAKAGAEIVVPARGVVTLRIERSP